MTGLIQKSGYIKPGNGGGHYAEYIATREGVELLESPSSSHEGSGYLEYMAQRPRSHGLFSAGGPADLEKTMEEINGHTGPVWTFVYSLKREDAHRLGYQSAKEVLEEYENPAEQMQVLEQLWQGGFPLAAYQLGKCWRDGRGVLPDDEQAELWFRWAAEAGYDFAQYALGKLLQSQNRTGEAVSWDEKAAAQGNSWAAYRLGKLYLEGKDVPKDVPKAVAYLTDSAEQRNQYAQYTLGKLYLTGQDVKQDWEQAWTYFYESAEQGNEYAAFFLEHFDQAGRPNVFLSATKLLHHLGQIFRENSVPPAAPVGQQVDRKLRRKIQEKKIAMGHKPDDHEEEQNQGGMVMGGM